MAIVGCSPGTDREPRVDGIVLVTVDGLIPSTLSLYGGEISMPHLEEIAGAGRVWSDVWTPVPMSRPAVASYLTGLAPDRHGVRDDLSSPLREGTPTLAGLLSANGYETAAFPGSSFLGFQSGLPRDFDVVDDPPFGFTHVGRWLPQLATPEDSAANFAAWIEGLSPDGRFFGWVHLGHPLWAQLLSPIETDDEELNRKRRDEILKAKLDYPNVLARTDAGLGIVLAALQTSGRLDRTLVIVVGTTGDVRGGDGELFGPGYSLDERSLQVPLVVRAPSGGESLEQTGAPSWGLDVPATIADLAGVSLAEGAEGRSLLEPGGEDRALLAFSWATRDQQAWPVLRAARIGAAKRVEGLDGASTRSLGGGEVPSAVAERLAGMLEQREDPPAPAVELDEVLPVLENRGIAVDPVTPATRRLVEPDDRRLMVRRLWAGRATAFRLSQPFLARRVFRLAYQVDDQSPGVLLDRGHLMVEFGDADGLNVMTRAVSLYPQNPDVLHWYAHAIWSESLADATTLLEKVLPFKPADGDVLYDLACARSLEGDLDASQDFLRQAIEAGFTRWEHMEIDPDLRNLREGGQFAELAAEYSR